MPVQASISKEDTEEVAKRETAVKWMVVAMSLVNVINRWYLADRPPIIICCEQSPSALDLKTYSFLTLFLNKNVIILT